MNIKNWMCRLFEFMLQVSNNSILYKKKNNTGIFTSCSYYLNTIIMFIAFKCTQSIDRRFVMRRTVTRIISS